MSIEAEFRTRLKETRAYLRSLRDIEGRLLKPGRGFWRAAKTVTASRAAAYVMLYNCIESAIRSSVIETREHIVANVPDHTRLTTYWRKEILKAHFRRRLRDGVDFDSLLEDLAKFEPSNVSWNDQGQKLPFAGNVTQSRIIDFLKRIGGQKWKAPPRTAGGNDLTSICGRRNDLAHGDETFEDVGKACSTQDLIDMSERVRIFMVRFIRHMDRYRAKQHYLKR